VELSAQEWLDKGKAAQTAGKQVEALSYFIRAANRDSSLTEAVNLANVTTANISSGNIGADTRNAIAWRKAWVALLDECDQYVANYVKTTPLPTYLVYSTDIQQGEINWEKETTALSFDISLFPDQNWPAPITGVVDAVYKGLVGTGQTATWKLDWPVKNASGGTSQVTPKVTVKYNVAVQLLNDQGALLGTQAVPLSAGWKVGFRDGKASSTISRTVTTVTFPAVDANRITDKLTIIVVSLDGQSAETAARTKKVSIMTYTDYQKPRIAAGLIGPAGGEIIVVDGKKLEVAPVFTEFMAHWSDAIARCKSLKVNGIGGWHLPTKEELDAMYQQLHKQGLGGFSDSWYWSSSEYGIYEAYEAWDHNFDDGHQLLNAKRYRLSVRAVREL